MSPLGYSILVISLVTPIFLITSVFNIVIQVYAVEEKYIATLSGKDEVPPVDTDDTGSAIVKVMGDTVNFQVNVTDMDGITMGHIHMGKTGANGDVVAVLYKSDTPSEEINGVLAEGNFTAADLQGPMQGKTIADLVTAIGNGETYVNIHTQDNPNGEIRGQISK